VSGAVATAQQPEHEFSFHAAGGLSTLSYATSAGKPSDGYGGSLGLGYTYYYYKNWGAVTGLDVALFTAQTSGVNVWDSYRTVDRDLSFFDFRSRVENSREKQTVVYLQIPLMLQYEDMFGEKYGWYCAAGTKVGFPLKSAYRAGVATLTTSGYYEREDWEYTDQTFVGFGTFSGEGEGRLDFKIIVLASIETGMKWQFENHWFLYAGVYCDYGVDNLLRRKRNTHLTEYDVHQLMEYNEGRSPAYRLNSILTSYNAQGVFTDKATLLSVGGKIKISFGLGKATGAVRWKPGWKPTRR
jgi:hypothetical protein